MDGIVAATARLATISVAEPLTTVAFRIATVASAALAGLSAGVAVVGRGQVLGLELSGPGPASMLDERQYPAGYGPALTAAQHGRVFVVDATTGGSRFDDFRRLAERHGISQVRSWPLAVAAEDAPAGSLTVYGSQVQSLSDAEREQFGLFLVAASVLLTDALRYAQAVVTAGQLQEAMRSRAVIEQAKGMIMADDGCSEDVAFERLKHLSSTTQRKVRDTALSIVQEVGEGRGYRRIPLPDRPFRE